MYKAYFKSVTLVHLTINPTKALKIVQQKVLDLILILEIIQQKLMQQITV